MLLNLDKMEAQSLQVIYLISMPLKVISTIPWMAQILVNQEPLQKLAKQSSLKMMKNGFLFHLLRMVGINLMLHGEVQMSRLMMMTGSLELGALDTMRTMTTELTLVLMWMKK